MATATATGNGYILYVDVYESAYNASTNVSTLTYVMQLRADSSPSGFAGYSPNTASTYIVINGVGTYYSTSGQRTVNRGSTVTFFSGTVNVAHDASTGAGSWSFYGRLLMQNPYPGTSFMPPDMTTNTATAGATTFTGPGQPNAPVITRASDGTSAHVVAQVPSAGSLAISKHQYSWSLDNSSWSTGVDMSGTSSSPDLATTSTSTYYIKTRAISTTSYAWGTGPWSVSSTSYGVPTAPVSISTTRSARDVTVGVGLSTGYGISDYFVQYSTDGGSTWSTPEATTAYQFTYTNLTPALTYVFRAYATNAIGNSAYTTSADVFVPAGGRRWDGSSMISMSTAKRWNGSAWVDLSTAKRWNGSAWVDLS